MKTIGIIGGTTWHSTADYYRLLNEMVNEKLGGANAAKIILYSVNFAELKELTEAGDWNEIAKRMSDIARRLEYAGADCLLLGANTMHKVADEISEAINIPIIHVAEATAQAIKERQLKKVALLGTKYVMQQNFYKDKLIDRGITTIIPPQEEDVQYINNAIYEEMGKGIFLPATKAKFIAIINELVEQGAQGIILGCTEIPILIKPEDCAVPVFDTTYIHAAAAVDFAFADSKISVVN